MLTFDPDKHEYRVNGIVKPGFSHVMDSVAVRNGRESCWVSLSGTEFCSDPVAADFGKQAHAVFSNNLRDIPCTYDNALIPWVQGFAFFCAEYEVVRENIKLVEIPLYSEIYGYCNTPDLVYIYKGDYAVVDWKTSTAKQDKWRLQTAAQAQTVREHFRLRLNAKIRRFAVRVYENNFDPIEYKSNTDFYLWLSILNTHKSFVR